MNSNLFSKTSKSNISNESYVKLQRDKAYFNFIVKHRYDVALIIFKEFNIPLSETIELFKWLFPQELIDSLHSQFEIHAIPYIEQIGTDNKGIDEEKYVKPVLNQRQMFQLKTFMPFFKEKLEETLQELKNATKNLNSKVNEGNNNLLRQACELFLFHSSVLIRTQGDVVGGEIELEKLLCNDNVLPIQFCKDALICNELPDMALKFLFHKEVNNEMIQVIREHLEKAQRDKIVLKTWKRLAAKYFRKINGKLCFSNFTFTR